MGEEIPPVEEKPTKLWLKIVLFLVLGIVIGVGLVFAGYKLGQKQVHLDLKLGSYPG